MKPTRIYGLVDPRDGRTRYVGKTVCRLQRRLNGHLQWAREHPRACHSPWIMELAALGLKPQIVLLEEVAVGTFWATREMFWIAEYRRLHPDLLNISDGGDGPLGMEHTPELRERFRQMTNARYADPEERRKTGEKSKAYWTPEARMAQAARMRAQWGDPEKRLSSAHHAVVKGKEFGEMRSRRQAALYKNNPEKAAHVANVMRERWADGATREGLLKTLVKARAAKKGGRHGGHAAPV